MNKTTIKTLIIGLTATIFFAACKKNESNFITDGKEFRAETELGTNNGKTHLNGTTVLWNANDLIKVRNAEGEVLTYELTEGENTTNGIFYTGDEHENFFQPDYTAIYPATEGNTVTGKGSAQFTLPSTQTYVANSFANGAMPMMAVSSDQSLMFKNLLGGICFPLTGSSHITRVVITGNKGEHLSGLFIADYNDGQPTITYVSDGSSSITLDCELSLSNIKTDFCIMLPPVTMSNGFTLTLYDGETKVFEKVTSSSLTVKRNEILYLQGGGSVFIPPYKAFYVGGKKYVWFAPGNLQYKASGSSLDIDGNLVGGMWRFASHQWDIIGSENTNIASDFDGWIDLFCWGTSGWNSGANEYLPYAISDNNDDYLSGYWTGIFAQADWGVFNRIYNPTTNTIEPAGLYRTLGGSEWSVIFHERSATSVNGVENARFAKAQVAGCYGVILFPDCYNHPSTVMLPVGINDKGSTGWYGNNYTAEDFARMEENGAVFLPAAGYRNRTSFKAGSGYYWSSTYYYGNSGTSQIFSSGSLITEVTGFNRGVGCSVRLVYPAE